MRLSLWATGLTLATLSATPVAAQSTLHPLEAPPPASASPFSLDDQDTPSVLAPRRDLFGEPRESDRSFWQDVGGDFRRFFSNDSTVRTVGLAGVGALFASSWDARSSIAIRESSADETFAAGQIAGDVLTHMAIGGSTYLAGRLSGREGLTDLGSDLMRAQILSQTVVHAAKFATNRGRPDGSDNRSLPSGHTATAFATAGVLQRHFGWKVGAPAYAVAGYVGASRMGTGRHYLSDVLIGAGIGIASAHTVTFDIGREKFDLGVAPTVGGATLTFTMR